MCSWRIALLERFWQARHPPRYAAFKPRSSPSSRHSSLLARLHHGSMLLVTRELGAQIVHRAILFAFTVLALFFVLRDGRMLTKEMLIISHGLFGPRGERIGLHVVASVHATLIGSVLVGLGEG